MANSTTQLVQYAANAESNISDIIRANPTVKQQTPKIADPVVARDGIQGAANNETAAYSAANPYGSYGSSMYGGGYGGGYGGSYGGYGGSYGGMYGMGSMYGMGGMGMYGMGMGAGMDEKGMLFNSYVTLQSFGFLVNSLSDIARSLDQNYEGLQLFKQSSKNLKKRCQANVENSVLWVYHKIKNMVQWVLEIIKKYILCMGQRTTKGKIKAVRLVYTLAMLMFVLSFYPVLRILKTK